MQSVFEAIMKNREITTVEIAAQIGKTAKTAQRNVKMLKEAGKIRRVGSDKTGYWEIVGQ